MVFVELNTSYPSMQLTVHVVFTDFSLPLPQTIVPNLNFLDIFWHCLLGFGFDGFGFFGGWAPSHLRFANFFNFSFGVVLSLHLPSVQLQLIAKSSRFPSRIFSHRSEHSSSGQTDSPSHVEFSVLQLGINQLKKSKNNVFWLAYVHSFDFEVASCRYFDISQDIWTSRPVFVPFSWPWCLCNFFCFLFFPPKALKIKHASKKRIF